MGFLTADVSFAFLTWYPADLPCFSMSQLVLALLDFRKIPGEPWERGGPDCCVSGRSLIPDDVALTGQGTLVANQANDV